MSAHLAPASDRIRADFLAFVEGQPDDERWELIDEVRVMQASPKLGHQIIAGNVVSLLNGALDRRGSSWLAIQAFMLDLTSASPGNMYVPDVLVIDTDEGGPDQAATERCFLAVEILSPSDTRRSGRLGGRRKIDVKIERYRTLPTCGTIMVVAQDRMDLRLLTRSGEGWTERHHADPDEVVSVEAVGLTCRLGDLYRRVLMPPRQRG